eukprot:4591137-Prymnesium_polylepis.2
MVGGLQRQVNWHDLVTAVVRDQLRGEEGDEPSESALVHELSAAAGYKPRRQSGCQIKCNINARRSWFGTQRRVRSLPAVANATR